MHLRQNFKDISGSKANDYKLENNRIYQSSAPAPCKKVFQYLAVDERIRDPEEKFRVFVFNKHVDIINQRAMKRYE